VPVADGPDGVSGVLHKPLTLSALRAALDRATAPRTVAEAQVARTRAAAGALGGKRVLLVEDNPINLEVAGELLREFGVDVVSAENGAIAVEHAAHQRFDLVLMDLQMPELDGLAATRVLRSMPGWAKVPILALTANVFTEDRERCLAAGMNDFVAKPVDPAKLRAVLQRWLAAEGRAAPSAATSTGSPIDAFAGVDGMDARAGLAAVRNNVAAYRRLLRQYLQIHGDDMSRLTDAMAAGDRDEARRIAHSLKGAAAVLGLRPVQEPAAELEGRIRGGASAAELADGIDLVRHRQARLAAALEAALAEASGL
jgi:CheY-like chemotaxis protein/HPt (histidine-containing phosphotransfer) domain-containing protein